LSIGWAIFWPHPRELLLAFLLAAPLVAFAIMIWARPLVNIDETGDEPGEISLFGLFAMPSAMLALRGSLDYEFMNDGLMLLLGLACSVPLIAFVVWCDPPTWNRSGSLASATLVCAFLAVGSIIHANTLLDTAPPERFTPTVVKKSGKGRYKNETLVSPWGSREKENKVKGAISDTLAVGDRVCIDLHPGALGLRWYEVARCPDQTSDSDARYAPDV
jgi:hypothetical protein